MTELIILEIWIFAVFCCSISNTQPYQRLRSRLQPTLHFTRFSLWRQKTPCLSSQRSLSPRFAETLCMLATSLLLSPTQCLFWFHSFPPLWCDFSPTSLWLHLTGRSSSYSVRKSDSVGLTCSKPGSGQAAGWLFLVNLWSYCVI